MTTRSPPSAVRLLSASVVVLVLLAGCAGTLDGLGTSDAEGGPADAPIAFRNATATAGIDYVDDIDSQVGVGNAGVYVADVNRDGWPDVLTAGGPRPVLWLNAGGAFERAEGFPEVSAPVKSATFVDYDDDGDDDLVLLPEYGEAIALRNEGGSFARDGDAGLGSFEYPLGGAAADYDGDGDEDLLVYQSGDWAEGKPAGFLSLYGTVEDDNGNPNYLFENVGGEFERVEDAGFSGSRWSLAASFVDLTGDGRPDVHVANDYNNDVVYENRGDGTFEGRLMGNATARNGMASEVGDVDGDGRPDVFVTNIDIPLSEETLGPERYERIERLFAYEIHSNRTRGNTLSVNRGDGTFDERAAAYGIQQGGWGWAASLADLNNDGRRDLLHATQNVVAVYPDDPVFTYPMVFERTGSGFERADASEVGFDDDDGRGMVTLDYDRDGDLDVVSANYAGRYTVYENTGADGTNALTVLAVSGDGSAAYGATVEVEAGAASGVRFQHSRTDYLSQEPRPVHVGLGARDAATLRVTWPDGTERTFEDVGAGRYVHLWKSGEVETVVEFDGRDGG